MKSRGDSWIVEYVVGWPGINDGPQEARKEAVVVDCPLSEVESVIRAEHETDAGNPFKWRFQHLVSIRRITEVFLPR